ncbi:sigma factor G inhibitor Gin [Marininema mesophilum]|uniref:sigma factor G inhibitor Gin n=1 Tax=Marininema mesophilum TaxID=1048340 RepID=UPI001FE20A80|nr:sigma factor G inhibitor Gin [Marininema mesophilum]
MQNTTDQIRCIVCEKECQEGITVLAEFICRDCEAEIVNTDVRDKKYAYFVLQMKNIWTRDISDQLS